MYCSKLSLCQNDSPCFANPNVHAGAILVHQQFGKIKYILRDGFFLLFFKVFPRIVFDSKFFEFGEFNSSIQPQLTVPQLKSITKSAMHISYDQPTLQFTMTTFFVKYIV